MTTQGKSRIVRCRRCCSVVIGGAYVKGGLCTSCADQRCLGCGKLKTSWQGERCDACARIARREWTDETIFQAFAAWAEAHGGDAPPTRVAGAASGLPSLCTVQRRFGSWSKAIAAAGLEPRSQGIHRSVTKGQRGGARNRQMVTGQGLADSRPGTVKHFGGRKL